MGGVPTTNFNLVLKENYRLGAVLRSVMAVRFLFFLKIRRGGDGAWTG